MRRSPSPRNPRFWLAASIGAAGLALVIASTAGRAAREQTGAITGRIDVTNRDSDGGIVVYLEDVPEKRRHGPAATHTIHQKDKQFVPQVTAVRRGDTVGFPNEDKIFHNVFSVSRAARFDLGLYKSGTSKSVALKRPGVVDVYCNIHPEMVAKIKVVDTSYYATTGADGRFRIEGVPPGTYPIVAWQPHGKEHRGTVRVTRGKTAEVKVELEAGKQPRRHLRKDGTPYGRYE